MNQLSTDVNPVMKAMEARISGLMQEKNEYAREAKNWKSRAQKAERKVSELEDTICQMKEGF